MYFYTIKTTANISPEASKEAFLQENDSLKIVNFELAETVKIQSETIVSHQEKIASHQEKITLQEEIIASQKILIAQYRRMLFGQKRERFVLPDGQLPLPFGIEAEVLAILEEKAAEAIETIEVTYTKQKSKHKGRMALPSHLEVRETIIEPTEDVTNMVCIGQEVTQELGYQAELFFVHRIIRKKYAPKAGEGAFAIATLPERVIDKGIPSAELLTQILVDKYIDHLPLYRIRQRFARNKIDIKDSTIDSWVKQTILLLTVLYEYMVGITKAKGYLQADETTLPVLDSTIKGKTHLGYLWAYNSPVDHILFFEYHPSRKGENVNKTLENFAGYLQTDGYAGYEQIGNKQAVTHLACMAHARREFEKAKDTDMARSQKALIYFQALYAIEATAREKKMTPEERKEYRLTAALPVYNALGKWITDEIKNTLPKSQIAKAMQYCVNRWDNLGNYMLDGTLEIDNNLIENAIRPIAIGRKNYLFAGSHQAAQRSAIMYTFFGICKKQNINPTDWLNQVLNNIKSTKINQLDSLLPQKFLAKD